MLSESRRYFYARVSSQSQNLDRQIEAFKSLGANERDIITDKISGKDLDRPGYKALKTALLRTGDSLVIKSIDRLSRSKSDIKDELKWFKDNKIRLMIMDLPTTMVELPAGQEWVFDMINNILIEVLSSLAEQERLTIKQRQAEGIAVAISKGKHLGRPKADFPENWDEVYSKWTEDSITAKKAMELLNMKRTTFYKLIKLCKKDN